MSKSHASFKLWFDRLLSKSLFRQLAILAVVLTIAFGLSYAMLSLEGSDWQAFCEKKNLSRWLLPLYLLIDSNALNSIYLGNPEVHGWMLFASSLTFLFGAFVFNGAIIGIITNFIEQRVSSHRHGRLHYLKSEHHIIMGYDDMVPSIISHIFEKDANAFVLILSAAESEGISERLLKKFNFQQQKHIIINYGFPTAESSYKNIHLESSKQIFIVGNRSLAVHDAINVECVDSICHYLNDIKPTTVPQRITCVFDDLDTYAAFKTTEIFGEVKKLGMEFVPYNFYAGWAKQIFVKRKHRDYRFRGGDICYPAVYGKGIQEGDQRYVHLVFVGMSYFSTSLAIEAANVLHFPNFKHNGDPRTRITFIDIHADREKDVFIVRNHHFFEVQSYYYQDLSEESISTSIQHLGPTFFNSENGYGENDHDFLDVEFEFVKGDVFSAKVQNVIQEWSLDTERQYLSIFIALSDQRSNFAVGMNLPDSVYDNGVNVFIRQDRSGNFVFNLRNADSGVMDEGKRNTYSMVKDGKLVEKRLAGRYAHIYPFGMNETAYSADEKSLQRAKLINYLYSTAHYDENKFQDMATLDAMPAEKIWEEANALWRNLNVALKWSNLYNAYAIRIKVASLRAMRGHDVDDFSGDTLPLDDACVEAMGRVEHNRWNVEKLLMGYRKPHRKEDHYAEENAAYKDKLKKNKARFIHHDIRCYDDLDDVQKLDKEFSRYIPWIIRMTENASDEIDIQ